MSADVSGRVKTQASSAWIGAAMLLFFGFGYLTEPSGTDLFSKAAWVFYQTLRIGGIAMAAAAAFLTTGHTLALAVDAVVAVTVGLLLIATGAVMFIDGGEALQPLINVICGTGFASSGRRSWAAYTSLAAGAIEPPALTREDQGRSTPPPLPRGDQGESPPPPLPRGDEEGFFKESSEPLRASNFEFGTSPPSYLASLAEKKRKERGESSS